ncbi:MAG: hypothetical protein CVV64_15560 [Candidatus Wallbacteria bacterium HGW-Wallbacteria-1]|jgi:hypothetical protein|uniref:Uncharacterized protein n=1 Tax=Candidatus Wallbacteria bacterium HGW-Wallbacteria-1 TaxID=2013854 RepID=A0A2N1PLR6_9BACT|nr:MAG: hypothetical protein CVV64_15560 [Candidatus Wallbacteria bacterium HGW-Wallbacteria-1]
MVSSTYRKIQSLTFRSLIMILMTAVMSTVCLLPVMAQDEGPSPIPEGLQGWKEGQFTVTRTGTATQGTMKMTTTVRTEVTGRTQDSISTKTTTTLMNKMDIQGREVITKSTTTVDTTMDFGAQLMTTSTSSTTDGMTSGPFETQLPLDMSKLPQPAADAKAPDFKVESITTPAGTFECRVYTFGEGSMATKTYMCPEMVPFGGFVKTKGPGVEVTLIECGN